MVAGARFSAFVAALVASAALAMPAMAANTYYAAPAGAGTECTQGAPCSLPGAVSKAINGDGVVLLPGAYTLSTSMQITRSISLGGESETNTTIQTTGSAAIEVNKSVNATIHDFRLDTAGTAGGLTLRSGTAERVLVDYTAGSSGFACSMSPGASLINSVCWAHGSSPSAGAVIAEDGGGTGNTVALHNVTAIAANPEGVGILAEVESATGALTIAATNVIASGTGHDVVAVGDGSSSKASVVFANSDYSTVKELSGATITPPGTNGGRTAVPAFVDAAAGNFAEATGSPTIDAGVTEVADGGTAIAGELRALPAACNGTPVTDIGAYEFVPTGCSSSSPSPPSPSPTAVTARSSPAPSNQIKIDKLVKNPKKGTATLLVSVPDAGTLTLAGKGVKTVNRRSDGAAKLRLPIRPVGGAKRQLSGTGSVKLRLRLSFLPDGGSLGVSGRPVRLLERQP